MLCQGAARSRSPRGTSNLPLARPEEVLSQAFTPYFTTKAAGSGTGLGLLQVQRFAEGRGGAVCIESERGGATLVRLFLPRVHAAGLPGRIVGAGIAYTQSPNGGVFHVV